MIRVRVDFNARGAGGTVRGSFRRADGPIELGDRVGLYDPDEADMEFEATVVQLNPETGSALFDVEWAPVQAQEESPTRGSSEILQ